MKSELLTLTLLGIIISNLDLQVLAHPERYNRLPFRGHSQVGGGQDPAHRENRDDLCTQCFCSHIKAICDFQQNKTLSSVFNNKYAVPLNIKYIEVRLTAGTQFVLHENLFQDNQVNYFGVIGVKDNDQVEMTSNAFFHNKGGYPSIEISKVSSVFLQDKFLPGAEFKLLVDDVDKLVVFPNAFQMTNLDCTLRRIRHLELMKNAFNPGGATYGINLRVENSTIDQLGIFGVSMSKVSLVGCHIGRIMSNAFDVTSIKELFIDDCDIAVIESQALTNKLHSDKVAILSTVIGTIEGQAISQSGITTMIMSGNTINKICSNGIQIVAVNLFIRNNTMRHLEPNWLSVGQADQVAIEDNSFDNYGRCELNIGSSNCSFRNNKLQHPQAGSLNFTCRVHQVRVGRECTCDKSWLSALTDHDLESEVMCQVAERHGGCFNATSTDLRRFVNEACGGNATMRECIAGQWHAKSASDQLSGTSKYHITWIACLIAGVTLAIVLVVGVVFRCWHSSGGGRNSNDICLIAEDIREQLQQRASVLKVGDGTRNSIMKLINGQFSKEVCHTRIMSFLGDLKHKSPEIEALLFQHIAQCHMNPPTGDGYGPGAGPTSPSAPSPNPSEGGFDEEPVYQEPDQQRPLICGEYSSPPHHLVENPYSEPFNATNANDMPPPYQYATPMRILTPPQQLQQPSTMANYATPVWRSTPSATPTSRPPSGSQGQQGSATAPRAVKDLRQALQNSPQFHPNQLTSARNQRQILQNLPVQPPPYSHSHGHGQRSQVRGQRRRSFECLDGAASLAAMEHMDSGSDHSGGSDVTVQIADVIDYADA
ncbi:uncharacterized protein LOC128265587 isoform X1 [Drosophila gunungcola]|uniref:uncharacterized protein LOC128265587 isoform X1 n=2 Tax=Drosophila gunungcola TaxID=103775 RepID=UPI0022E42F33|nr:uncharacterized protein LOC128265587 isoform X1 [Drosophila gunungcola]XP_052857660.1 uncharacterized protein LOC128265587 isoform X1 [Drosophila gunungcola]